MKFISWIPNLFGRISFRLIGGDTPRDYGRVESFGRYVLDDDKNLHIYFSGYWYASDSPFKSQVTDFFRKRGLLYYRVFGLAPNTSIPKKASTLKKDEYFRRDEINGKILYIPATPFYQIFRHTNMVSSIEREIIADSEKIERWISHIAIDMINAREDDDKEKLNFATEELIKLDRYIEERFTDRPTVKILNFKLEKNGKIVIECPEKMILVDSRGEEKYQLINTYTQQSLAITAFNIMRNKIHSHKHHSKTNDALIGVYEYLLGDMSWKYRITSNLRKIMKQFHDDDSVDMQLNAKGVGAYLATFGDLFFDRTEKEDLKFGINDSFEKSLSAKKERNKENFTYHYGNMLMLISLASMLFSALAISGVKVLDYISVFQHRLLLLALFSAVGFIFLRMIISTRVLMRILRFGMSGYRTVFYIFAGVLFFSVYKIWAMNPFG
jgi:hypothetical protein